MAKRAWGCGSVGAACQDGDVGVGVLGEGAGEAGVESVADEVLKRRSFRARSTDHVPLDSPSASEASAQPRASNEACDEKQGAEECRKPDRRGDDGGHAHRGENDQQHELA
jgi:hypothetical protein